MELAEIRSRDVEIVKAMGWTDIEIPPRPNLDATGLPPSPSPEIKAFRRIVPHFHTDENARRMLLTWLAAEDELWTYFLSAILPELCFDEAGFAKLTRRDIKLLATASPEDVADAAFHGLLQMARDADWDDYQPDTEAE